MTSVGRLVDTEALTVAALLADSALAAVVGTKVSTELPTSFPDGKRLKLARVGGTPVDDGTEHLDRAVIQIEAFGDTKADAFDVAAEAMAAVLRMDGVTYSQGFVTDTGRLSGPAWSPDPETVAPRYLLSVAITAHA